MPSAKERPRKHDIPQPPAAPASAVACGTEEQAGAFPQALRPPKTGRFGRRPESPNVRDGRSAAGRSESPKKAGREDQIACTAISRPPPATPGPSEPERRSETPPGAETAVHGGVRLDRAVAAAGRRCHIGGLSDPPGRGSQFAAVVGGCCCSTTATTRSRIRAAKLVAFATVISTTTCGTSSPAIANRIRRPSSLIPTPRALAIACSPVCAVQRPIVSDRAVHAQAPRRVLPVSLYERFFYRPGANCHGASCRRRLAERAGLTGVSSHSGRRGLAAELVRRVDDGAVQMAGGLAVAADGRPLRLGREISPLPQTTRTCSAASWHGMQNAPQLSRSVAGGRRARARSRSKMDLRRDVRGGEQQGHAAMAFDPGPCPGRNPAGHLQA